VVCVSNLPVFSVSGPTKHARFKSYEVVRQIRLVLYCFRSLNWDKKICRRRNNIWADSCARQAATRTCYCILLLSSPRSSISVSPSPSSSSHLPRPASLNAFYLESLPFPTKRDGLITGSNRTISFFPPLPFAMCVCGGGSVPLS